MACQISDSCLRSPDVLFLTRCVTNHVVVMDRRSVGEQDRDDGNNQNAHGTCEIIESSLQAVRKIGIATCDEGYDNARYGKSGADAQQVNSGEETVQHEEGANQSTPDCPAAIEEEFRPNDRAGPNAV